MVGEAQRTFVCTPSLSLLLPHEVMGQVLVLYNFFSFLCDQSKAPAWKYRKQEERAEALVYFPARGSTFLPNRTRPHCLAARRHTTTTGACLLVAHAPSLPPPPLPPSECFDHSGVGVEIDIPFRSFHPITTPSILDVLFSPIFVFIHTAKRRVRRMTGDGG